MFFPSPHADNLGYMNIIYPILSSQQNAEFIPPILFTAVYACIRNLHTRNRGLKDIAHKVIACTAILENENWKYGHIPLKWFKCMDCHSTKCYVEKNVAIKVTLNCDTLTDILLHQPISGFTV